jgi:zinc/manganese transport system permease protein
VVLAVVSTATLLVLACCARPLLLATFDPLAAEAAGLPVQFLAVLETVLLGTVVASVSQLTGSLLVFALLVMPASAALQLTTAIWPSIAISIGIGIATTWVGLGVAFFVPHLPLGFTITTTGFATYLVASAWRGLAERPRRTVATA